MSSRPSGDAGASAVEYGLLLALIAAVVLVGVTTFGLSVSGLFDTAANAF